MAFGSQYDRRKYHEEYWKIYEEQYSGKHVFTSLEAFQDWPAICAMSSFEELKERHPAMRIDFSNWYGFIQEEVQNPTECPTCGEQQHKALYMGMPTRICKDSECATLTGLGGWIAANIWFDGVLFLYTGSYWLALKDFLFKNDFDDPIDYN
mgnify:CR=1 FL=1